MHEKSEVIVSVCNYLDYCNKEDAIKLLQSKAPLESNIKQPKKKKEDIVSNLTNSDEESISIVKRQYTAYESTCLFIKDGFIDRYNGERLVFPGVFRVLSDTFPNTFPFHPNWKYGECHQWYWELLPTVDHIVPVTLGGPDESHNWVTTSMFNNLAKSNTPLENLGWEIAPCGDFTKWDGLIHWFISYISKNNEMLSKSYIKLWYKAACQALKQTK